MAASQPESEVESRPIPALTASEIKWKKTYIFHPWAQLEGV